MKKEKNLCRRNPLKHKDMNDPNLKAPRSRGDGKGAEKKTLRQATGEKSIAEVTVPGSGRKKARN